MELTRHQLDNLYVRSGRVLIELDELEKTQTSSGVFIKSVSDDSKQAFSARCGKVVRVNSDTDIPVMNYFFHGECEVEEGDVVWWSKDSLVTSLRFFNHEHRIFTCEGKYYVVINYKDLLLRLRDGEYMGLNNRVIVRPIIPNQNSLLDLSMSSVSKPRRDVLEVVYLPSFNGEYKIVSDHIVRCEKGNKIRLRNNGSGLNQIEDIMNKKLSEDLYSIESNHITEVL